jgi:hypothetical protein
MPAAKSLICNYSPQKNAKVAEETISKPFQKKNKVKQTLCELSVLCGKKCS